MAVKDPRVYETGIDNEILFGLFVASIIFGLINWGYKKWMDSTDWTTGENIDGASDGFVDAAMFLDMNND